MWLACFIVSLSCLPAAALVTFAVRKSPSLRRIKIGLFNALFAGIFIASLFLFFPIHTVNSESEFLRGWRVFLLSVFHSMQVFTIGCEFSVVQEGVARCPEWLRIWYQLWAAALYVAAPIFTFGFVLSLFKNLSAYLKYIRSYFCDTYVFSELNERSLAMAHDICSGHKKAAIVFTDVFEDNAEYTYEMIEAAKKIGAICFKKDIVAIDFKKHSVSKSLSFFTIGNSQTENLNQSIKLIENYKDRKNTNLYVFSSTIESELLLGSIDKGEIKVRRINEVRSLVTRVLYERGDELFESAKKGADNNKIISVLLVGLGSHGTEMLKALAWYCQMDGYRLQINAFDRDPLAEEKFTALAPELMSEDYNGVYVDGEAQYSIKIYGGLDVSTDSFARAVSKLKDTTLAIVALGNDDVNIGTAVNLRMYFERMKINPVIQAIVYNSQQKKALERIRNYRGQPYDIEFIGDMESSYTEAVIIDSELEEAALKLHLKWGKEEDFWAYEYNYRSSMASALHMRARIKCGIPGADKREEDLNDEERNTIGALEHRRWNAYMRAEGYVYSGSNDKASRNDLAKMHHDLVDYASLPEREKEKDSKVGTLR